MRFLPLDETQRLISNQSQRMSSPSPISGPDLTVLSESIRPVYTLAAAGAVPPQKRSVQGGRNRTALSLSRANDENPNLFHLLSSSSLSHWIDPEGRSRSGVAVFCSSANCFRYVPYDDHEPKPRVSRWIPSCQGPRRDEDEGGLYTEQDTVEI